MQTRNGDVLIKVADELVPRTKVEVLVLDITTDKEEVMNAVRRKWRRDYFIQDT